MFILSQGLFSLSRALPVRRRTKETGREHSWDRWPELTKGTFYTTEHHAQYMNWGELPRRGTSLGLGRGVWHGAVGGEQLYGALLVFPFSLLSFIIIYRCCCCILLYFQLFNSSCLKLQVLLSPPRSTTVEGWGGGWVSGCVVLNFQLGLNHNTDELLVCLCSNPQVRAAKEKDHEKQTPLKKNFSFLLSD